MKAQAIVVPVDFSTFGETALRHATTLAREAGATLHLVHVQEDFDQYADAGFAGYVIPIENDDELRAELERVQLPASDVPVVRKLLKGHTAEEIVKYAKSHNADMIVMGTHGRRGITRLLMGSVAEAIVRQSTCPVLTIKEPVKTEAT